MLNWVFLLLVLGAVLSAAFGGTMPKLTESSVASAKAAVELAIGLIGQMAVWLGFMRILQDAGLMASLARALAPVMRRIFPSVPPEHPAMGAMIMNLSANILGLGNAATPFGLKAMVELNKLNSRPGVATDAMVLFLAINTSGIALLPLGVIAIRATLGSTDPAGIFLPTLFATFVNSAVAIGATLLLAKLPIFSFDRAVVEGEVVAKGGPADKALAEAEQVAHIEKKSTPVTKLVGVGVTMALLAALVLQVRNAPGTPIDVARQLVSDWLLPLLMVGILTLGFVRGVKVYESFIAGAKESFQIAIGIIPFLVAILVAIGMFRASGALEALVAALSPLTSLIGLPGEALPMALIRPLSGSGAMAVMTDTMKANGPDSLVGWMVSVMNGTSETTFYVLAVYFGAVGVKAVRHTVLACLISDVSGVLAAVWLTRLFHH